MTRRNPWDLTRAEQRAVILHGLLGAFELIAEVMGIRKNAVHQHLYRARRKMGVQCNAQAVLRLERWKRGWSAVRAGRDVA